MPARRRFVLRDADTFVYYFDKNDLGARAANITTLALYADDTPMQFLRGKNYEGGWFAAELAAITVTAMQAGITEANERLRDRVADVSVGLHQALTTKPGHVKRRHDVIVRAIEASSLRGSKWADETIARESQ